MTTLSFDVTVSTEDSQDTTTVIQDIQDQIDISDTNFESIIDQDWDDIAVDDGLVNESYSSYSARIFPRPDSSGVILESKVDGIQYSPELNAAVPLTVDVEPLDALKSQEYLSGIIDVFVNGKPLFSGEIVTINTLSKDDSFYSIKAKQPGQKLNEDSVNLITDNFIVSDFVAKTIDRYNSVDDEHFDLINTSSEQVGAGISVDGKRVRSSTSDGSQLQYNNVGPSATEVEKIYLKLGAELATYNIDVTVNTVNSSYTQSYSGIEKGSFGQWVELVPDSSVLSDESYDIIFTMDSDTFVYDWVSITDQALERSVEVEGESTNQSFDTDSEVIQEASSSTQFEKATSNNLEDTLPIDITFGSIDFLQTAFYGTDIDELLFDGPIFFESFANYTANRRSDLGEGYAPEQKGNEVAHSFYTEYKMPAGEWGVMMRYGDPNEDLKVREAVIEVDGQEVESFVDGFGTIAGLSWFTTVPIQTDFDLEQGGHRVTFKIISDGEDSASTYDALPIDILGVYDQRFNYTFDNEVDNNYNLDGPEKYPLSPAKPSTLQFNEIASPEVINEAELNISVNDPAGVQELGISFDGGNNFFSSSNDNTNRAENLESTASVIGRIGFSGYSPSGAQNETPKYGYAGQSVSSYSLSILTVDVELLFKRDISGNRLSVISDLCDEFSTSFRWEGNNCKILTGQPEISNVELRKEQVESILDIEDVYSSARVIGKGVESGVIEAKNAPDYVDRRKQITDPDVTTEQDAKRKAEAFLDENSQIYFEGNIETLPTRAPLGEALPGSLFDHGQDSVIRRARYSKRNTSVLCDREKDLRKEILDLDRNVESTNRRDTL